TSARIPPRVLGVHPDTIRGRGSVRLLVVGRHFTPGTEITVGGVRAQVLAVRNPDAVIALAPRGVGTEVVRAVTSAGTSASNGRSRLHFLTRVLVVGDSLGIDLGWGFTPALDARDGLAVADDAVGSTGLVRTDFYDWPTHLREDLVRTHADVVVTLFGTNDEQALPTAHGMAEPGTAAWNRAYAARVRQVATIVRDAHATLVWVSLPRMGPTSVLSPSLVEDLVTLDGDVVATLREATFVNAWLVFTAPDGAYTPYVELAPHDWVLGHEPDGTHLTPSGAAVLDARAMVALARLLTER
ncbi:MAG TPA: DUF459 domain-containing protein, partial [Acidimicrobiales bacterium]|nr:DUF459 domain-containing protein [Acidimicrobiales bacterium]